MVRNKNFIASVEIWLASLSLGIATLLVFIEVVLRYGFASSLPWLYEVVLYLIIASTFFGGSYLLSQNKHITIDVLLIHLSERTRLILQTFAYIMGVAFCVVVAIEGSIFVSSSIRLGIISQTSLSTPQWIPQLVIPIAALLMLIHFGEKVIQNFQKLRPSRADIKRQGHG